MPFRVLTDTGPRLRQYIGPVDTAILEQTDVETERQAVVHSGEGVKVVRACTIHQPVEKLFQFWRNFENLPRVMKNLVSVTQTDPTHSHWIARRGKGKRLEWDAEIINEHPNELIAWKTTEGSDICHAGSVRFRPAPGQQGVEVVVALEYDPHRIDSKILGRAFGKKAADTVAEDLYRFKALMETGEIPTTEGQPVGGKPEKEEP